MISIPSTKVWKDKCLYSIWQVLTSQFCSNICILFWWFKKGSLPLDSVKYLCCKFIFVDLLIKPCIVCEYIVYIFPCQSRGTKWISTEWNVQGSIKHRFPIYFSSISSLLILCDGSYWSEYITVFAVQTGLCYVIREHQSCWTRLWSESQMVCGWLGTVCYRLRRVSSLGILCWPYCIGKPRHWRRLTVVLSQLNASEISYTLRMHHFGMCISFLGLKSWIQFTSAVCKVNKMVSF